MMEGGSVSQKQNAPGEHWSTFYPYDCECYPNFFSCVIKHSHSGTRWIFEASERINQIPDLLTFLDRLEWFNCYMVGFNNEGYDYQLLHHLMSIGPTATAADAYRKSDFIINTDDRDLVFKGNCPPWKQRIRQIDLYKIHHFDNVAKRTSLKETEFNMRSQNIGDLPVKPGELVPRHLIPEMIDYNAHDVDETEKFMLQSAERIDFRMHLTDVTGINMISFNDTKIGKEFFKQAIDKAVPGVIKKKTQRRNLPLADVIFRWLEFEHPEMIRVVSYMRSQTITRTKAPPELAGLSANIEGFKIDVGAGGIHGSLKSAIIKPGPDEELIDVDVTSFYPALAIKNRIYPEHLTEVFCDVYESLFKQRASYPKKTPENEMLKLALNGVFGDSNSVFSFAYDPRFTMRITINGQLLICLLAEKLLLHTRCELIQANTDGVTVLVPNSSRAAFDNICQWWETTTQLNLEYADYQAMFIRDVNSYIAQTVDGKVKRIGAYAYERAMENPATREVKWDKDHSALVVPKAAEAAMLHGIPPEKFILSHTDAFDFMLRYKVSGGSRLQLLDGTPLQKCTRYIISTVGQHMEKIMPPTDKQIAVMREEWKATWNDPAAFDPLSVPDRHFAINKGWMVHICDNLNDFRPDLINYDWYIQEAEKLII